MTAARPVAGPAAAERLPGIVLAFLVVAAGARADDGTGIVTTNADSLLAPTEAAGLDSLRAKMERSGWAGSFSGYVFARPGADRSLPEGPARRPEDQFLPWQGRPVRHIHVERINVFSPLRVGSPASPNSPRLGRWGDAVHMDTREFVIRGFILQEEGAPLDVRALVDTERLLRQTRYILEADIEVVPVEGSDEVDVIVITRDRWSIGARAKVTSPTKSSLSLFELNLLGRAIQWDNRFDVNTTREVGEEADYTGSLAADNVRGSFVRVSGAYSSRREVEQTAFRISRTVDVPEVRTVGHALATWTRTREADPRRLDTEDLWLGRAIYSGEPGRNGNVSRLFLHARSIRTEFHRRPAVSPDSNRVFHDQVVGLGAVSWSTRSYRKDHLVFGWGRTEDIPVGYRLKLTGGYRWGEFEEQPYAGVELRQADFHDFGYVTWIAEAGGFLRDGKMEESGLGGAVGWYGTLISLGSSRTRPVAVVRMAHVFRPLERDRISIGDSFGIPGIPDTELPGLTRFSARTEATTYTRFAPWGFRVAVFGNAAAGTVAADPKFLAVNRWFSVISFGLRIHNEHLVFDAVQLSVSFYPSTPPGVEGDPYYFGRSGRVDLPGFEIDPPRILRVP